MPDGITARLIKDAGDCVIIPLLHIINLSITIKTFPAVWKHGTVTPIHNEGDKKNPNNCCPIAILNTCSKLIERVVQKQLYMILHACNFLVKE